MHHLQVEALVVRLADISLGAVALRAGPRLAVLTAARLVLVLGVVLLMLLPQTLRLLDEGTLVTLVQ